jgi:hypothetical protein
MLLPDPATELKGGQGDDQELTLGAENNARFPCTHKKEPVDFH